MKGKRQKPPRGKELIFFMLVPESRVKELCQIFNAMGGIEYQVLSDSTEAVLPGQEPGQEKKVRMKVRVFSDALSVYQRICASELSAQQADNAAERVS